MKPQLIVCAIWVTHCQESLHLGSEGLDDAASDAACVCDPDVNGDGHVVVEDLIAIETCISEGGGACENADVDCNNVVDLTDLCRAVCSYFNYPATREECCAVDIVCGLCLNAEGTSCSFGTESSCEAPNQYLGDGTTECPNSM